MTYSVFGFRSGTLDTVRLHVDSLKRKAELMPLPLHERMMRGCGVDASGFDLLERRFGQGFVNFVLLDDVAIEACQEFKIPLGERVGAIELTEMGGLAIKMFAWAYWTLS
jgi:hypothetical protein